MYTEKNVEICRMMKGDKDEVYQAIWIDFGGYVSGRTFKNDTSVQDSVEYLWTGANVSGIAI